MLINAFVVFNRHSFDVDNSSTVNKNATLVRVVSKAVISFYPLYPDLLCQVLKCLSMCEQVKPGDVDDTTPKRSKHHNKSAVHSCL